MTPEDGQQFSDSARPDEKTVQKVARGEVPSAVTPRKQRRREHPVSTEVTATRVNPWVWVVALSIATDPKHIQIRSSEEVVVWNHGPPWPEP